MIDINSSTFVQDFDISRATVGQIGYGFIGNAVVELFRPFVGEVLVHDVKMDEQKSLGGCVSLVPLESVVSSAEVIFVAVPTPMRPSGECHTGIVESVLQNVQNMALKVGRSLDDFIVVLKSTVPPGFTTRMQDKYALRLMFSPEFLTEANAVSDFKKTNRVILGGDVDDARVVNKYFEGVWPGRIWNVYDGHPDGPVQIIQCEPSEAEMVKLSTNVHLTARVMVSNELYLICQRLGIDYDRVKLMTQLDRRIGTSHMNVPGDRGLLGFGGHCFYKDTQSLKFIAQSLGTAGVSGSIFQNLIDRNLEIREDRDWETMPGRAVITNDD